MSDINLQLEEATLDQVKSIAILSSELGYEINSEKVFENLKALECVADCKVWVVLLDHEVIGWCHAAKTHWVMMEPMVEVLGLVVSSRTRNKGVGRMLISKVEEWADSIGVNEVWIRSNRKRKESHPFYLAIGFTDIKDQAVYVKEVSSQRS